ncbi:ApeA N-terminal domain 1-containing protein [Micromonospora chalcea]|uniref:ApeA N-terminal domain 1-containing protein n=1 Tax=Micromonospora chalcea TaxID=1874 RepID=UPI0037F919C4
MNQPFVLNDYVRLGHIFVSDSSEPPTPALVRIDENAGIDIDIPVAPASRQPFLLDDPAPSPEYLHFKDDRGVLTLGGCRVRGHRSNSASGSGRKSLQAAFAVSGSNFSDASVKQVRGLRSEIAGLHGWMGWQMTTMTIKNGANEETEEVGITKKVLAATVINEGSYAVRFAPLVKMKDFAFSGDETHCETLAEQATSWDSHLALHSAIRDLIAISLWHPVDYLSHEVQHPGEPRRLPSGKEFPPPWRSLHYLHATRRTHNVSPSEPRIQAEHFTYNDLGEGGVKRWFELSRSHSRGIAPLMSHLYLTGLPVETQITHIGISLEALRFADRIKAGDSIGSANSESIASRASGLARDVGESIVSILGDVDHWGSRFAAAYNGVKHANRPSADPAETFWLVRSGALVARARLLQGMGIPSASFNRLQYSSWWHPMKEGVASSVGLPNGQAAGDHLDSAG